MLRRLGLRTIGEVARVPPRISGKTLTVKVRFANFATVARSVTLDHECDSAVAVYSVAQELLSKALGSSSPPRRVRLLGVSVSRLTQWPASEQISFERRPGWSEADRALDRIRHRFGERAVRFASLLDSE